MWYKKKPCATALRLSFKEQLNFNTFIEPNNASVP